MPANCCLATSSPTTSWRPRKDGSRTLILMPGYDAPEQYGYVAASPALHRHPQFGSDDVPCLDWPFPAALGAPRRVYWRYTAFPCVRPPGLPVRRLASKNLREGLGKTYLWVSWASINLALPTRREHGQRCRRPRQSPAGRTAPGLRTLSETGRQCGSMEPKGQG